ncbi:MAG: type III restriction endonuclease subunit R [Thermodesulfobacteriota bacterium]|nr:MAG: type III restriction endonuclease subunit R [Thermodesulfobacteriota bacterium]
MDTENLHYFYRYLDQGWQEDATLTRDDLLRYEQNIVSHTLDINEKRDLSIVWKYYQWLSLLFVEAYLDCYFNDREGLLSNLNKYLEKLNAYWKERGFNCNISRYTIADLNKICIQNATGSGKTLLMHVNLLQFRQYSNQSRFKDDLTRTILITPNESLSEQHDRALKESGIRSERLYTDSGNLFSSGKNGLRQIDFTEITKLADEDGPNLMAIRNLGDQNLLLVDEAHRGMGSKEETGWFKSRERLVENGFVFEYSATFREAVRAAKRPEIEDAYTKNIIFDYSYRYFYEDGYGKDYRIFNLPKTYQELQFSYLTACLLAFYQQLKLYEDKKSLYQPYNIEKPLWVFVGRSVSKATGTNEERSTISDVALILQFISSFLKHVSQSVTTIEHILNQNAKATGLIDDSGNDIFSGSFLFIREMIIRDKLTVQDIYKDILAKVFRNRSGGQLKLARIKGDESEVMLKVGQEDAPFGLINVGDASGLIKHIEDKKDRHPEVFENLNILESEFSQTLFGEVHLSSSPITVLLGSKKFVEGWDCWRVSTLGLMHVGKSEGSQIIQLFGRGVRLKGYDWSLKRSGYATPTHQPGFIQYLETLNVFGVEADFMDRFKKFLEEEQLPSNDQKAIYTVPLNITYDFGHKLKILRPKRKNQDGREYNFKRDGRIPEFGQIPSKLQEKQIEIDWYPRIQSITSKSNTKSVTKDESLFTELHLAFLDYDDLFFRLEKFKRERSWYNFNIPKATIRKILSDSTWYKIYVPSVRMNSSDIHNLQLWQEMACELLQKYCDEFYNYCKAAFFETRLELRPLEQGDANLPVENEYQLIVDSHEHTLIQDILSLQKSLNEHKEDILTAGDLKACLFDNHLYKPVIHVAKGSKIQVAPVSLNESEFQFIEDLLEYLESNQLETDVYLLRNESRGKGMGFFEAGNFYPDFLLWQVKDKNQYLAFIEPHGLLHEGPGTKKIKFHKVIKEIEERMVDDKLKLNSFIVTPTRFSKLAWGKSIQELKDMNVLFMNDSKSEYVNEIMLRMCI